ncbi:HAMP domain-containing sensor histidine kinase [Streptomyces sp. NPDC047097]|uniref:sensor histidine kinase n=1 Tax=Streptomyces sp. NPDC047097 TaxID=3155260 RepID=UPI0033F8EF90
MRAVGRRRHSPARRRLRRLQFRLTLAYTLVTLAGVSVLCWMVIRTDARSWREAEYDEMDRRAAVSASLIYYDEGGRLRLDGLQDDAATRGRPRVVVLHTAAGGALERVFTSRGPAVPVASAELARLARTAMTEDATVRGEAPARDGTAAYLLAQPYYHDETHRTVGAVVVVGDPDQGMAQHRRLTAAVLTGSALLTCVAALTGHLLSGRSLRPAWQALEAQERLLADAAHELRTPVAIMRSSVDTADADPRRLQQHLPRMRRATDRLADVVDNVLTRGRLQAAAESFRPEPLRLDQLVEQVCAELPPAAQPVSVRLADSVVAADPALVRIAVRNLLDNALRHGATPGGTAEVAVSVHGATVTVADRGPGLAPGDLPELLERYRSDGGGTGIGLSLVHEIATAHGGTVTVRTRPGGGSVFVLRLGPGATEPRHARGS